MYQMKKMVRPALLVACILAMFSFAGCRKTQEDVKIQELDYTVLAEKNIPTPLLEELEVRKKEEFRITYEDGEYLYLCVGYGQQESGGYSIQVKELGLYEDYILLDTTLLGPSHDEAAKKTPSYPYMVLRTELRNTPVMFE